MKPLTITALSTIAFLVACVSKGAEGYNMLVVGLQIGATKGQKEKAEAEYKALPPAEKLKKTKEQIQEECGQKDDCKKCIELKCLEPMTPAILQLLPSCMEFYMEGMAKCESSEGETVPAKECLPGWLDAGEGNGCFKIFTEKKSFQDAQGSCRNVGGFLAEPRTKQQRDFIKSEALKTGGNSGLYFIGMTDEGHEGSWTWLSDGKDLTEFFWGKNIGYVCQTIH